MTAAWLRADRQVAGWRLAATGVVAGIAAYVSYQHVRDVVRRYGESGDVATLLPLSVDGLIVVASLTMVDDHRKGRRTAWVTRLAFWLGVVASLSANVLHAQPPGIARVVAAWPSLALLLTVEVLARPARAQPPAEHESNGRADAPTPAAGADPPADLTADPVGQVSSRGRADSPPPADRPAPGPDLSAVLDTLGVPPSAGRDRCRRALSDAGVSASTAALSAAVRARKAGRGLPGVGNGTGGGGADPAPADGRAA